VSDKRYIYLDGMRGWASSFVLLYHVFVEATPVTPASKALGVYLPFNGLLAVYLFFFISGFSLSVGYFSTGDLRGWIRIAAARYLRLVIPIFVACLIVHIALVTKIVDPTPYYPFLGFTPTLSHLMQFSLFDVFFRYDFGQTYIGPLWTMSPELYGSAVTLAAALLVRPLPLRSFILLGLSAVIYLKPTSATLQLLTFFPLGAAIADWTLRGWVDRVPRFAAYAMIAAGCAIPVLAPGNAFYSGLTAGPLLMIGCIAAPQVRSFLSNGFSQWLGRISFPLYLIHGPILNIITEPLMPGPDMIAGRFLVDLAAVGLSLIAAICFSPVNDLSIAVSRRFGRFVADLISVPTSSARLSNQ
jgi:peptidoglycan/LPS O-acetylase OafA/YrhL